MSIIDPPPDASSGAGGMEYPTLVTTATDSAFTPDGVRLPEVVTVHEVGHNWFQGILASNEVDEAWLDEGVNEYTNGLVMHRIYGTWNMIDWRGNMYTFDPNDGYRRSFVMGGLGSHDGLELIPAPGAWALLGLAALGGRRRRPCTDG